MSTAEVVQLAPRELATYHRNPRRGDTGAIMASLLVHGQYRPLTVNRGTHTGRPMEVLAGNHTLLAIRNLADAHPADDRWAGVDAFLVDVDDDEAARIVVADNRTHELGDTDQAAVLDLLTTLPDTEGTGYSDAELTQLQRDLAGSDAPSPWDNAGPAGQGDPWDGGDDDPDDDGGDELGNLVDLRQIVLQMTTTEYGPLIEQLDELRMRMGKPTYVAVVLELAEEADRDPDA